MDDDKRVELLIKVGNTPGLCSKDEIEYAVEWLECFNEFLKIYKAAYGEPAGLSVDSCLDQLRFYING